MPSRMLPAAYAPVALVLAAMIGAADAQTDVAADLTGVEIECVFLGPCFPDQVRDSVASPFPAGPPRVISPATGYAWTIEGVLNTTAPLSALIPTGSSFTGLLDSLQPGNSFLANGYVRAPAATLPDPENTVWREVIEESFGSGAFTLDLSLTIELTLDQFGALTVGLVDIDIPTGFLTGTATFDSGFARLDHWTPSPVQITEWSFDGDFSSVPGSGLAGLAYLDDPAFGTILGGIENEDDPSPSTPTGVTEAQSSFMSTAALGIAGPGGEEDTVYITSPARNLTTGNPDHRRGIGLALFPATQPIYPGRFYGQWTMVFDLYIPSEAWYTDFPTNSSPREFPLALLNGRHDNAGSADAFFRNSGGQMTFGNDSTDFSSSVYKPVSVQPDTWFRLALVNDDFIEGQMRVFVDGVFQGVTSSDWLYNSVDPTEPKFADGEPIDPADWAAWGSFPNPWVRSSGTAPGSQGPSPCSATVCLFADLEGGRSESVYVANLLFADGTLSDPEIAAFGGPDANGITEFGPEMCNGADFAEPFGELNFNDVIAYLTAFAAGDPAADLAPALGVLDFNDVITYLTTFAAGCP